jgi:PAS domain S-box-containing protein
MPSLDTFKTVLDIAIGFSALGVGRGIFNTFKSMKEVKDIKPMLEEMRKELKTNGGSSVKDVVNSISKDTQKLTMRIEAEHRTVQEGIYECDLEGNCTYVNRYWCLLSGLLPDDALGSGWLRAIHPDDVRRVKEEWTDAVVRHADFIMSYRYVRPNGDIIKVKSHGTPLRTGNNIILGYYGRVFEANK